MATMSGLLYPGSTVLINKAGIQDQQKLDVFERGASGLRLAELKDNPIQGNFDLAHMQAIHGHIFKDVYEWAGQIRTVNITKGREGDKTIFTLVADIPKGGQDIQRTIKDANYLRGMERDAFSGKMAEIYKKVNDLHPFREGNGRTTREFFNQLADGAGYNLNYSGVSRQEWNTAAKESARGNLEPMRAVFKEISTPQRAVAFDKLDWSTAMAKHPELDGAIKTLYEARKAGKNIDAARESISKELHLGRVVAGGVTPAQSLKVINHAAEARGLEVQAPGSLGSKHAGVVVASSSHHVLLKVDEKHAVRFDRSELDKNLNLKVGDKLTLQHQEFKQVRGRETSESIGMERVPASR